MFERAWVIAWPDRLPSKPGFIVSIQRDGDVAAVEDVGAVVHYPNDEVGSMLGQRG